MKCTDKEQETCEVEKRGCKGCYYYNNDEQENINNLFKYIGEDEIYQKYINNELKEISDFEMFCIHHCQDIEKLLKDYIRQKQINEEHQKINGELRERVKELECENRENKKKYLALLIGQFPDTTETYKKYKKELEELLQEEDK